MSNNTEALKERGMIFNGEMVRAILDGRKTQTRRMVKGVPSSHDFHGWVMSSTSAKDEGKACWAIGKSPLLNKPIRLRCPFGDVGDRIWVRETFASGLSTKSTLAYRATHKREDLEDGFYETIKWTPSIHMPRWASRITLEITGVRVERLNSMSEEDAIAEGCSGGHGSIPGYMYSATPHEHFHHVWTSIYGEESWQANPWVWVIEFKRVEASND